MTIKLKLPNGRSYDRTGKLEFINNTVAINTDTIMMRGVMPNPPLNLSSDTKIQRELTDGEFVTVSLEEVDPEETLTIPRAAVLSDQQGEYVLALDGNSTAIQRRVQIGSTTSTFASIVKSLVPGDKVVVDGLQRVRQGRSFFVSVNSGAVTDNSRLGSSRRILEIGPDFKCYICRLR